MESEGLEILQHHINEAIQMATKANQNTSVVTADASRITSQ